MVGEIEHRKKIMYHGNVEFARRVAALLRKPDRSVQKIARADELHGVTFEFTPKDQELMIRVGEVPAGSIFLMSTTRASEILTLLYELMGAEEELRLLKTQEVIE